MLRIKPAYLAALEQGRSHDLPGPTYAIGFIRAYADFLGLDADQVLVRFKAEAAGATARPDLALPVPLGERSLPGGALVLVALIVALCGYGIWYYLSTDERDRPQRVAAVPAALQTAPAAPAPVSPGDATAASSAANSPPAQAPTAPVAAAALWRSGDAGERAGGGTARRPSAIATSGIARSYARSSIRRDADDGVRRADAACGPCCRGWRSTAARGQCRAACGCGHRARPRDATAGHTQPAAPPLAAAKPVPASAPAAPAAADPAAARIAIRALSDCWIQVRGPDQAIVFSRVLKSGEVYKVPSRAGLSLRTGNAGALEIAVDGKTAPAIGGVGTLRRDVVLDPSELAAGTAVHG